MLTALFGLNVSKRQILEKSGGAKLKEPKALKGLWQSAAENGERERP